MRRSIASFVDIVILPWQSVWRGDGCRRFEISLVLFTDFLLLNCLSDGKFSYELQCPLAASKPQVAGVGTSGCSVGC